MNEKPTDWQLIFAAVMWMHMMTRHAAWVVDNSILPTRKGG